MRNFIDHVEHNEAAGNLNLITCHMSVTLNNRPKTCIDLKFFFLQTREDCNVQCALATFTT